ncbi:hypothetical protein HDU76_008196, partial [Blyttiomyces sp. JEL0837]
MKRQWKTILQEASLEALERARVTGKKVNEESEAMAGDEKEDGDVVSKIKERKYIVGEAI